MILFELLTGDVPFRGDILSVIRQVINSEPPRLQRPNAKIDHDLTTITLKCLQKEPAARYATAELLADDLDLFLRGAPINARHTGRFERSWKWLRSKTSNRRKNY